MQGLSEERKAELRALAAQQKQAGSGLTEERKAELRALASQKQPEVPLGEKVAQVPSSMARGVGTSFTSTASGLESFFDAIVAPFTGQSKADLVASAASSQRRAEELNKSLPKPDPRLEGSLWQTIPEAGGSAAFFGGSALVAGPQSALGAGMVAGGLGSASQFSSGYYDALGETGDPEIAFEAALKNAPIGLLEGIPLGGQVARVLGRVNKATGGGLVKLLVRAASEGGEEAAQELVASGWQDLVAKHIMAYDEDRKILEGALTTDALPGFVVGAVLGAASIGVEQKRAAGEQPQAQAQAQTEAQQAAEAWTAPVETPEPKPIEEVGGPKPIEVVGAEPGTPWQQAAQGQAGIPAAQTPTMPPENTATIRLESGDEVDAPAVFLRFGDIPKGGVSTNYATGEIEGGTSVYKAVLGADGKYRISTAFGEDVSLGELAASGRPVYEVSGELVGEGADGEPILSNAQAVKQIDPASVTDEPAPDDWTPAGGAQAVRRPKAVEAGAPDAERNQWLTAAKAFGVQVPDGASTEQIISLIRNAPKAAQAQTASQEPAGSPKAPTLASEVTPASEAILEAPVQSGEAQPTRQAELSELHGMMMEDVNQMSPERAKRRTELFRKYKDVLEEEFAADMAASEPQSPIPLPSEAAQVPQSETQTAPKAPEVDPADTVSIANRKMQETSAKYGLEPAEDTDPETFVGWFDEAKAIYDTEPQKAAALVTELEDSPRAPTAVEDLVLGLEVRARVNALDEAIKRYNADSTEENRKAWEVAAERYESIKDTVRAAGTASGRSLVARKALIGAEFTYEGMLGRRMAAEGGESALLREEGGAEKVNAIREEVKRQYDEIKEIEKQQAVESAKAESEARVKALTEQVEALRKKVREQGAATPKKAPSKAPSRQREIQRSKARIDELVKELAVIGRRANVGAPLDPKALKIVFDIAVEAVRVGAMTFQEWTSTIKAHIDAADAELQKVWSDAGKSVRAERADTLKSKIESGKGPTSIRGTLIEIAESIIRDNMEIKSEALADEVYAAVKDAVPGWSRDQVAQVLSGYGNYKKLTDDLVKRRRQQLLSEVQTDMKLLDVAKGERPKKSGVERMPPSDSQRRKTQQLHEEMKRAGINPAGEYDLKSALDAAKTRERNLISDLDYAIEQRERIVKERKLLVPDAELAALKARRAESQKTYDEMFAMERQAEQRAREIAYVEEQIAAGGKTKPNTPVQGPPSDPKIAGLDKRLMDLKAKLAEIRKNDPEKLSKAARIKAERETASFEKKIAVLESVIANRGKPAPKAGPVQGPPADPKRAEYQRQIMFLKERVAAIRKEERTKASQSEEAQRKRLIASLERQIANLEGKDAKAKEAKPQGPTADPQVAELQRTLLERRAELQRLKAADEARAQKALEQTLQRSIIRMEQMIREDGKRPKTAKERPTSPLIRARESELKALKAEFEALSSTQKSKEERLIAASVARKLADIERLERNTIMQGLTGEHIEMKKRERRAPTKEEVRLAAKREEALNRNLKSTADIAWKKASRGKKALVALAETPAILRSLRTAFDFSAVLVQAGAPTLGHPLKAIRTWIPNMIRAAKSEEFYQQLDAGIRSHPLSEQAQRDGLEIAELDGKMSKREEMFAANILQKLPGIAGAGVRGSSRAYLAYINAVRMDSYASIYRGKPWLVTDAEAKEIAKFVNVFTGRGDLATLDEAFDKAKRITNLGQQRKSRFFSRIADGSAWVLWAPRLYLSRLQMLMSPLYYAKSSEGKTAFIRKTVAKEMARWLAAEASVYMLVHLYKEMSDDDEIEVETDPRSSDFGKYRVGETRIDPWGGLAQFVVLLSRIGSGETKNLKGEVSPIRGSKARKGNTGYNVVVDFARGKFNPFASFITDYFLAGQNVIGESRELPKSVGDTPRFAGEALGNYLAPMLPVAIYQNLRDQGFSKGAAFSILSAFGTSIQNYDR